MAKSADAFRTISEVSEWLDTPAHVLRFWESKFTQVKPVKRAGGRRYYRPSDMELLGGIKKLLHEDGMTIKGVQKLLREKGVAHVAALSQPLDAVTAAVRDAMDGRAKGVGRPEAAHDPAPEPAIPAKAPEAPAAPPAPAPETRGRAPEPAAPRAPVTAMAPAPATAAKVDTALPLALRRKTPLAPEDARQVRQLAQRLHDWLERQSA
ncbi:transcriptional regulator, MerR family protein [Pseudooceanicola batsensis HTCC2597]|uniref:Transcriptional regulator, MerR family protein n=1 Tax=Pseudooceanicola batsensis (strain ATCC BAA-863 / DSM 15984 / KCTC 12145 / HTCC2597) TaxID=252305 RepID=A3TX77_PSEBH|nr:MerR family transcriptional regulator [Pseudooceanicola batsensis]EAQ03437.1 transcriptional regulator, MerR family protein [Pseudooceanicola batsensis HTCC2597]